MLDALMLTIGFVFFAASIAYVSACDRLWGQNHARLRLFARRARDRRPVVLPGLRPAQARAVL